MKINREEFLRVLESAKPGVQMGKEIIDQSTCFVFQEGLVRSFNDEVACRAKSKLGKDLVGAVQAGPFLDLLYKLVEEEIDVTVKGDKLLLLGKGRRADICMEREVRLPVEHVEDPGTWVPLHPEFTDALTLIQECAGKDETRFALTCIHIHPKWVEATDNLHMARYRMKTGFSESALVRRDALKGVAPLGVTDFSETPKWVHFKGAGGLVLSCRQYKDIGEFPDYTPFYALEGERVSLPKGLVEAADRAEIFSKENPDANQVTVELRPGKVRIVGVGVPGKYQEIKNIAYQGMPQSFGIAPGLLKQLVSKHNECVLAKNRLLVDGGKWRYATVLNVLPDKEENGGEE